MQDPKIRICLMLDKDAERAAQFYAETFPNSSISGIHRAPTDYPSGKAGDVLTVEFIVVGPNELGHQGQSRRSKSECKRLS